MLSNFKTSDKYAITVSFTTSQSQSTHLSTITHVNYDNGLCAEVKQLSQTSSVCTLWLGQ